MTVSGRETCGVFRTTEALRHDLDRPPVDPAEVAAEYGRMYAWLRDDDELAAVCGFAAGDLTRTAEALRVADLRREIDARRAFTVSPAELAFFVRHAWMASDRCSGRRYASLQAVIRYLPDARSGEDMLRAAVDHARLAMDARAAASPPQTVVTVLGCPTRPGEVGQLFATEQLIRFAGYRAPGGTLIGDGGYRDLTGWVLRRAPWTLPATPGPFDVLPMVAVGEDGDVAMAACPPAHRYLVDIPWPRHPEHHDRTGWPGRPDPPADPFGCWTALPLQTNFALDVAGQRYAVLFNGWYVDEEIAVNLLAPDRYDWAERVSSAIHGGPGRDRMRRADRLDEYRMAQVEIATLRAVRAGFRTARHKLDKLGPSQAGFGRFRERYRRLHGEEPPNDPGWTANRLGSRYRHPSHPMPHVPQTRGSRLVKLWLTFRSLRPDVAVPVVDLSSPRRPAPPASPVAVNSLTTSVSRAVIASSDRIARPPDPEGR